MSLPCLHLLLAPSVDCSSPGLRCRLPLWVLLSTDSLSLSLSLSLSDLPLLVHFRSRRRSRAKALCVSRQNKEIVCLAHTPTYCHKTSILHGKGSSSYEPFLLWQSFLFQIKINFPRVLLATFRPTLVDGLSLELEWQQVSRTLLSILTDLDNALVRMVSVFPTISKSSSPINKFLGAALTVGFTVILLVHSYL